MIKSFWEKLDAKQKKLVAGMAIFVVIALLLEIAVFPFRDAREKLSKAITVNQKRLDEINELSKEFSALEAKTAAIRRITAMHGTDFTLFSYLERRATLTNVRGRIKYMNSSRGVQSPLFEESLIDMKLEKITIKQLVDFLYAVESPADLVRIKKITVSKMKESPEYLSAQLQVSSLQPLNPQQKNR